jgi:hypothetical protein
VRGARRPDTTNTQQSYSFIFTPLQQTATTAATFPRPIAHDLHTRIPRRSGWQTSTPVRSTTDISLKTDSKKFEVFQCAGAIENEQYRSALIAA